MRRVLKPLLCSALSFTLLSGFSGLFPATAFAEPANFLYEACSSCAPLDLAYSNGEFDQVHWVASKEARRHPMKLSAEWLGKALAQVQMQDGKKQTAWLDAESAQNLANGLAAALEKANPQQESIFFVTNRASSGFVAGKQGNSGRAFIDARGLNLIVGEAHVEFFGAYRATRMLRKFDFGSTTKASPVKLLNAPLAGERSDWLLFPLQAASPVPAVQPVSSVPAAIAVMPAATSTTVPAVPANAAPTRDEKFYAQQEMRLKSLKRMREQNLLSEEEYQAKRREILQDL